MSLDIFSNQTLQVLKNFQFQFIQIKIAIQKGIKINVIIKNYEVIINGKSFYDESIDFDIKRYEEIRKLATAQGEDYITGFCQIMNRSKNHYRLIVVDFNRQK